MDNKIYTITLADGTKIENLSSNGNNFITKEVIEESVFEDNLSPVVINDGETDVLHEHMELVQIHQYGDEYWFILRDISEEELSKIKMQADIAYVAMMAGVTL
nr:MAG TPA: hypothetical protein [Caudoviricetes sp.]